MADKQGNLLTGKRIAFLGAGKIAQALVKGFIGSGLTKAEQITTSDPVEFCRQMMSKMGVSISADNKSAVSSSHVIYLCVKPNMVEAVLKDIAPIVTTQHLIISVAAGVTLGFIEKELPAGTRVMRVMPNTPAVVGAAASVFARGTNTLHSDGDVVKALMDSVGFCNEGKESILDAVTGLSGSGPAYGFTAIEALADGGVNMGLPRDLAIKLAAQTLMGAAKMVLELDTHPMKLKDDVCSPGGTTIAGIYKLEAGGFRKSLMDAVEAATNKSKELKL